MVLFYLMKLLETFVHPILSMRVPPLLCRHPPPVVGRDDDMKVLRNVLDELIVKSGHFMYPRENTSCTRPQNC